MVEFDSQRCFSLNRFYIVRQVCSSLSAYNMEGDDSRENEMEDSTDRSGGRSNFKIFSDPDFDMLDTVQSLRVRVVVRPNHKTKVFTMSRIITIQTLLHLKPISPSLVSPPPVLLLLLWLLAQASFSPRIHRLDRNAVM